MARVKWLLLYSREQDQFHIEDDTKQNYQLNKNGYTVVSVNTTKEECEHKLEKFINIRNVNKEALIEFCKRLDDMESSVLAIKYKINMENR